MFEVSWWSNMTKAMDSVPLRPNTWGLPSVYRPSSVFPKTNTTGLRVMWCQGSNLSRSRRTGASKNKVRTVEFSDHWPVRAPGNITGLWFVTHHQAAIARGCGHRLHTPETNDALGCGSWLIVRQRSHAVVGTVCIPRKQMTRSAVVRDSSGSDRTRSWAQLAYPGNKWRAAALAVVREPSSVSVNITRPDWLNSHTPPALITWKYRRHFINVEMLLYFTKCAKRRPR